MQAADLIREYEAKIAALERMVGRQALEIGAGQGNGRLFSGDFWIGSFPLNREFNRLRQTSEVPASIGDPDGVWYKVHGPVCGGRCVAARRCG